MTTKLILFFNDTCCLRFGGNYNFLSFYPWAMTIILGLSLIIALLFVPFLQYTFIKKGINESSARRRIIFEKIQIFYRKLLIYCLQKPKITLLVGFIVTLLGMFLYFEQPLRLMPGVDRNQFCVEIYLPNGKSLDQTALLSDSLRRMLSQDKRVKSITSFIGSGSPRFHDTYVPQFPADNYAQFIVMTDNEKETIELLDKYSNKYANYFPNAYIKFKQLDYSEARYPIELRLTGDSINELKSTADSLLFHLRQMKELTIVHTNLEEQLIGTSIKLNDSEMSKLGIYRPTISLHSLINIGEGIPIARLWEKTRSIPVILKGSSSDTINSIENLNIPAMGGITSVPLRQIGVIAPDWNEGQIYHRNGKRSLSIIAEMQRGYNENEVAHIIETKILPKVSISKNINVSFGGIKESDMERLPQILFGLLVAIVIMFFILTFHFKKISLALLTLCSTILCFFGSGVGMLIMNTDISLTSILGIVSLIGILLRNGIILIDYTEFLRKNKNFDVYTAALEASIRRIRPILLTSIAAAVGVIPMLIEGSSLWKPLGTVIFFGTIITVFFIATILPVSYVLLYKSKNEK